MEYFEFQGYRLNSPGTRTRRTNGLIQGPGGHFGCQLVDHDYTDEAFWTLNAPNIDSVVVATKGLVIPSDDPLWYKTKNFVYPCRYFGNAVSPDIVHGYQPREYIIRARERSKMTYKQWARSIEANAIVFNTYFVATANVREIPGVDQRDIVNTRTQSWHVDAKFYHYVKPPCDTHSGAPRYVELNGLFDEQPATRIVADYKVHTLRLDSQGTLPSMFTPGLPGAIESFVNKELKKVTPIKGLVTEVLCEANEGAWDALTSVMENMRETVPMIFRATKQVLELYQSARGKVKNRRSLSKASSIAELKEDIANIWLWYRYAVTPTLLDIESLLELLDREFEPFRTYRKGRETFREFSYGGWTGRVKVIERCIVRDRYTFHHLDGVGFNVPSTGWQMLPLSFMIDWVLNINQVLIATEPPTNIKARKSMYSVKCEDTLILTHPDYPGAVHVALDTYSRTPISSSSYIDLEFKPSISYKRMIDAWAIFFGNVKDPHRYR